MKKIWDEEAWADYLYWQANDQTVLEKINSLIKEAERTPFTGTGKPEPLKGQRKGYWSRRITKEHRLVYRVREGVLEIASCKEHYDD